jgi:hypothetical protein
MGRSFGETQGEPDASLGGKYNIKSSDTGTRGVIKDTIMETGEQS